MFDVWFDGARVEPDVMRRSETKLQEPFNLTPAQASILVNGKSHRIKRGYSADEAQQLAAQFACWGAETRIHISDCRCCRSPVRLHLLFPFRVRVRAPPWV